MLKRFHFEQNCLIDKLTKIVKELKHIQLCVVNIVPADGLAPLGAKTSILTMITIAVYLQHWNGINKQEIQTPVAPFTNMV